ncbi:MAG TPA: lysophospholipid acyltransferase family protein [Thermoanaerobaculia bacterium]|nr:lysophospholipid acyltransferase family protein [Thermoanaerobaculia bacterium]
MRLDPQTRLGSLRLRLVVRLMDLLIRALARSWRLEVVEGREVLDRVLAEKRPVIFCFWHDRILPACGLLVRRVLPAGTDLTLVSSPSKDGELSARFILRHGGRVVRGSASRRGARALREVYRTVARHGSSPILIPDGPKGPAHHFKAGVVGLAQLTRAPVFLMGYAATRSWTLGTWDRMLLPKPFARIAVAVAPPREVPRELSEEEAERERALLEARLGELTRAAAAAASPGAPGSAGGAAGR